MIAGDELHDLENRLADVVTCALSGAPPEQVERLLRQLVDDEVDRHRGHGIRRGTLVVAVVLAAMVGFAAGALAAR